MIASFPMYDRPQTRDYYAMLWDGIRDSHDGPLPDSLTFDGDPWDHWTAHDLILSQTCGLPYRARLANKVALVGTPDYCVEGCPPGYYNSVVVMRAREDDPGNLGRLRLAYNDPLSQSGWAAAMEFAEGPVFADYLRTGGHAASVRAVLWGEADIAFVDAVTWRMIVRWDAGTNALKVVAKTSPQPGLPLITAKGGPAAELAKATSHAIAHLSPAARDATGLRGLVQIPAEVYLAMPLPPQPPK